MVSGKFEHYTPKSNFKNHNWKEMHVINPRYGAKIQVMDVEM